MRASLIRAALTAATLREFDLQRAGQWVRAALLRKADARRWCAKHGVVIEKAQNEGAGSAGAYLVPQEFGEVIAYLRDLVGVYRANARPMAMTSDSRSEPVGSTPAAASFVGEAAAIAEASFAWSNAELSAKKLASFARISNELVEDAAPDAAAAVAVDMAYAIAQKEDAVGFAGTGVQADGGIRGICPMIIDGAHDAGKVAAAAGHDTYAELDGTDLATLISALPSYALPGARWYVSPRGLGLTLARLGLSSGASLAERDIATGRPQLSFAGFPVEVATGGLSNVTTTLAASVMILFGDLSLSSMLGTRRGFTMAASEHRNFEYDQTTLRATERIAANNFGLGDNSVPGSVVGLVGTA